MKTNVIVPAFGASRSLKDSANLLLNAFSLDTLPELDGMLHSGLLPDAADEELLTRLTARSTDSSGAPVLCPGDLEAARALVGQLPGAGDAWFGKNPALLAVQLKLLQSLFGSEAALSLERMEDGCLLIQAAQPGSAQRWLFQFCQSYGQPGSGLQAALVDPLAENDRAFCSVSAAAPAQRGYCLPTVLTAYRRLQQLAPAPEAEPPQASQPAEPARIDLPAMEEPPVLPAPETEPTADASRWW